MEERTSEEIGGHVANRAQRGQAGGVSRDPENEAPPGAIEGERMNHLSHEELIDYHYGENSDNSVIEEHLHACSTCAETFAELQGDLAAIKATEPPMRDAAYDDRVWTLLTGSLPDRPPRRRGWFSDGLLRGLSYAAACALLVAGAFYAGRLWEQRGHTRIAAAPLVSFPPQEHVVLVILGDHLDSSERLLVELKHVDADNTEMIPPLRDEARNLLAANHICLKNAEQSGDPALEGALGHLDSLLDQLANQPGGINAAAIERMQSEMNVEGLLLEVRVLRTRIAAEKPFVKDHSRRGQYED